MWASAPLQVHLIGMGGLCWWGAGEVVDASAVHEVGADQSGEGERAVDGSLSGLGQAQQQEGDEGDGDLDAHGVLTGAEEVADLQGLLDPAEEQLDSPAPPVERGDLVGGGVEVVAEDAQHLAGLGGDADLPHRVAERVLAAARLALRQQADAVREDAGVDGALRERQFGGDGQAGVGLEAGDQAAAGPVHGGPPAVIVVAQIEDIGGAGLDRHGLGRGDVVDLGGGHGGIDRPVGIGIVDHVQLGACGGGGKAGPLGAQPAEPQPGGIDQIGGFAQRPAQAALRLRHHQREQLGEQRAGAGGIGVGQARARHRPPTDVVEPRRVALQPAHDVAQALRAGQLPI